MRESFRRFEIVLPRRCNGRQPFGDELVPGIVSELHRHFAIDARKSILLAKLDHSTRVIVDVADTDSNRHFFEQFKMSLQLRQEAFDILMTTYLIELV